MTFDFGYNVATRVAVYRAAWSWNQPVGSRKSAPRFPGTSFIIGLE
jgi:hypothetical protein